MSSEPVEHTGASGGAGADITPDDGDAWVAEHCSWWVVIGPYSSKQSDFVHLPDAIRDDAAGDPHDDPSAETLCYTDSRASTVWQTKPHAVMPVNYRPVCSKCTTALTELVDDD